MDDEMTIEMVIDDVSPRPTPRTTPVNDRVSTINDTLATFNKMVTNEARKFDREKTDRYFERKLQNGKGPALVVGE